MFTTTQRIAKAAASQPIVLTVFGVNGWCGVSFGEQTSPRQCNENFVVTHSDQEKQTYLWAAFPCLRSTFSPTFKHRKFQGRDALPPTRVVRSAIFKYCPMRKRVENLIYGGAGGCCLKPKHIPGVFFVIYSKQTKQPQICSNFFNRDPLARCEQNSYIASYTFVGKKSSPPIERTLAVRKTQMKPTKRLASFTPQIQSSFWSSSPNPRGPQSNIVVYSTSII
jgi:hypothetical protein